MTYLSPPRFHFAGTFLAKPSTVNNLALNVGNADTADTAEFRRTAWKPTNPDGTGGTGLWNPNGSHEFSLKNVTVRAAIGFEGPVTGDPVVGLTLATPGRPPAKLVDLDPDEQLASMIFGMAVTLRDATGKVYLSASLTPVPFTDIWNRLTGGASDGTASAAYQSTLTNLQWAPDLSSSPFLSRLRAAAIDGLLSIKFNVDGYAGPQAGGRIVGTVGVAAAAEPTHTVLGRHLGGSEIAPPRTPDTGFQPHGNINFCVGVVDTEQRKICLDLGNAVPAAAPPGTAAPDIGELTLAYRGNGGTVTPLAPIDYRSPGWYESTAGIIALPADRPLTDEELAAVVDRPLLIAAVQNGQQSIAIEETPVHVRADIFINRLNPGDPWTVRFFVTELGKAKAGAQVDLQVSPPPGPADAVTKLLAGLEVPASVITDAHGVAEATLTAHDPGNPRFYNDGSGERRVVDGQVYMINYAVSGSPAPNPSNRLSVLVWNRFPSDGPVAPGHRLSWTGEIGPILRTYGNLYPFMTVTAAVDLDLAVYEQVIEHASDIADRLQLPITNPRYMPVTRDLSGQKTQAILAWLNSPGDDGNPLLDPPAEGITLPPQQPVAPGPDARSPKVTVPDPEEAELGSKTAFARRLARAEGIDP